MENVAEIVMISDVLLLYQNTGPLHIGYVWVFVIALMFVSLHVCNY